MSVTALHLYEQLTEATDDRTKAKIIAEAFGQLEERYPSLKEVATQSQLRETELRLQKDIEIVRKEIEGLRLEVKSIEGQLRKDTESVRLEVKNVEIKIAETRADLVRWVVGVGILQSTLIIGILLKIAHLI